MEKVNVGPEALAGNGQGLLPWLKLRYEFNEMGWAALNFPGKVAQPVVPWQQASCYRHPGEERLFVHGCLL